MAGAFAHGLLLALALIAPLGPQNAFVLAQGATQPRWRSTLPVVVAAALSDTALIGVAVAGASLVVLALPALRLALGAAGLGFLLYMGFRAWTAADGGRQAGEEAAWPLGRQVRYSLSVSLLNPHAILDTVVVLGGGAAAYATTTDRWAYAIAAATVSWLWFLALSLVGRLAHRVTSRPGARRWINRGSAVIMWAVALRFALQLLRAGPT